MHTFFISLHVEEMYTDIFRDVSVNPSNLTIPLQWRHTERGGVAITSHATVYSTVYQGADQREYQDSASLALVRGIPRTKGK